MQVRRLKLLKPLMVVLAITAVAALLAACGGSDSSTGSTSSNGGGSEEATGTLTEQQALEQTLAWIEEEPKTDEDLRIAWLKADAKNPYTLAEQRGGLDAAKRYGADVKVFDASFNPTTQFQQFQDALTGYESGDYDGIVVEPVAGEVLCPRVMQAIEKDVPIAVDNQPLCGDDGYTEGAVGYAGVQLQRYFDQHAEYAFKSCKGEPCEVAVITGPVGFDVTTKLQNALKMLEPKFPNVEVVANQASDFSAQEGLKITRDTLTAHPNVSVVISQWDDQMTGVVQAVEQAGKKPGTDVRIYSNGADKTGVGLIEEGRLTESSLLMPYEEGNYAMEQMIRFLLTGKKTPGTVWLPMAPIVKNGPGDMFITKENASEWTPEY